MGALNIPSAADIERITRRLRSVSQRLEGIEDALDRLEARAASASAAEPGAPTPNQSVEQRLDEIARDLAALRQAVAPGRGAAARVAGAARPSPIPERLVAGGADAHADLLEPLGIGARGAVARRDVGHREDAGRAGAAQGGDPEHGRRLHLHRRGTAARSSPRPGPGGGRRRGRWRPRSPTAPRRPPAKPSGRGRPWSGSVAPRARLAPSRGRTVSAASRSPNSQVRRPGRRRCRSAPAGGRRGRSAPRRRSPRSARPCQWTGR